MKNTKENTSKHPIIIAVLTLLIILLGIQEYNQYRDRDHERKIRTNIYEQLIGKKSQLEKALYSRIYFTKSIAAYVGIKSKISQSEFEILASEFKSNDSVINTLSVSKDCIITYIYPTVGHQEALGLNLLDHPERKAIVEKTIATHQTFVAGPLALVEGGIALISYTPIFTFDTVGKKDNFWGVTDIVIKRDELFREANIVQEDQNNYYALRGIDGSGKNGKIFWGDSSIFDSSPVVIDISLPTGNWVLAGIPKSGWGQHYESNTSYLLYISAIIISLLIWQLANALMKLRNNEREMKAIFASMQDVIIQYNSNGDYVKIAPTREQHLILPRKELLGKNIRDVFEADQVDKFLHAIKKCLDTKELQTVEYQIRTYTGEELWFRARISYMAEDAVIFLAIDNTFAKQAEIDLTESESKLKQLNIQKDKFFSILAHDLRNPLASLKSVVETMNSYYDTFDEAERKDYLKMLEKSTGTLYNLLENLLTWSRSQRGKISFTPESHNLNFIIDNCVTNNTQSAKNKSINIKTKYSHQSEIQIDANMISTVLRNLISNAIKFTPNHGEINIATSETTDSIAISISDTGIGIDGNTIKKLFRIDTQVTTLGTNNEAGTGLGLILCKEFIDKHNGNIEVNSQLGRGTEFIVTLPKYQIQ